MADTYSKKEREKKKQQKKKEKELRRQQRKEEGSQGDVIMYVDFNGNFTENKPENFYTEDDVDMEAFVASQNEEEAPDEEGVIRGKIKFFDRTNGFGFITGKDSGDIYFSDKSEGAFYSENQRVKYKVGEGDRGPYAYDIEKM
jgi:cold shock CspA family protein